MSDDMEKLSEKKTKIKKKSKCFFEFGRFEKALLGTSHFCTRRWDAADHVLLTELQALTTASMTASSRAHGPHLETKDGNVECFCPQRDK